MSSLRNIVLGCVSEHGHETPESSIISPPKRMARVKFSVPIINILVEGDLPDPLVDIIVYIARDGVATSDLFRRPGSHSDLKIIIRRLTDGYPVHLSDYNFYTLASVIKMFLLRIPGGLFGVETERNLLNVLELNSRVEQCDAIHRIVTALPAATQHLVALLFGTWFRVVNHCEYNAMTSEAMAKSVAGSIFHTCAEQPTMVNDAVRLIRIIIDNFGAAVVLGRPNVQYFTERTCTTIRVREKYKYQLTGICPAMKTSPAGESFRVDCIDECRSVFARIVTADAACRGFDPVQHAVGEGEFYGQCLRSSRDASVRRVSEDIVSTTVSVELYGPPRICHGDTAVGMNSHPKLTHLSSLSAPDVNEGCHEGLSPLRDMSTSQCDAANYVCASLNRVDSVRRRQLTRMRKRSDWFLSPSQKDSERDQQAETCPDHSWFSENSGTSPSACKAQGFMPFSPTHQDGRQSLPLDSSAGLQLPQLCITDVAAMENDSLGCTSALKVGIYSSQVVQLDSEESSRSVAYRSPSTAEVVSTYERLSYASSHSSDILDEHRPISDVGVIQRRTIENNTISSEDDNRLALEMHLLETVGEDCVADHTSLLNESTDLDDKMLPSTMDSCRPNSTGDGTDHSPQLEAHYFVVDRFYGSKSAGKTNGGNF